MPRLRLLWTAALVHLIAFNCQAQPLTASDAKDAGATFGTTYGKQSVMDNVKGGQPATAVPGYSGTPSQSGYFQGGKGQTVGPGTSRVTGCTGQTDLECQAVDLVKQGKMVRPSFTIAPTDPAVAKAKGLTANPSTQVGDLFTTYASCQTDSQSTPAQYEDRICNDYATADPIDCALHRVVEVKATYHYQCDASQKGLQAAQCMRNLLVTCEAPQAGCASGGLQTGPVNLSNGSFNFDFNGYRLNVINNVTAEGSREVGTFNFRIQNLSRMLAFTIVGIHSDNWVGIEINGRFVGVHSRALGGFNTAADRLEIIQSSGRFRVNVVSWCAGCTGAMDPGSNFYTDENFSLLPYLQEGDNYIRLYVINGGGPGYGRVYIDTNSYCDPRCTDTWDQGCLSLEDKAK